MSTKIPRDTINDYSSEIMAKRRAFVEEKTGEPLSVVGQYGFEPASLAGNIEHAVGAAQVPIGVAGPLMVHGDHVSGSWPIMMVRTAATRCQARSIQTRNTAT